jgi:hypothetical protein
MPFSSAIECEERAREVSEGVLGFVKAWPLHTIYSQEKAISDNRTFQLVIPENREYRPLRSQSLTSKFPDRGARRIAKSVTSAFDLALPST